MQGAVPQSVPCRRPHKASENDLTKSRYRGRIRVSARVGPACLRQKRALGARPELLTERQVLSLSGDVPVDGGPRGGEGPACVRTRHVARPSRGSSSSRGGDQCQSVDVRCRKAADASRLMAAMKNLGLARATGTGGPLFLGSSSRIGGERLHLCASRHSAIGSAGCSQSTSMSKLRARVGGPPAGPMPRRLPELPGRRFDHAPGPARMCVTRCRASRRGLGWVRSVPASRATSGRLLSWGSVLNAGP